MLTFAILDQDETLSLTFSEWLNCIGTGNRSPALAVVWYKYVSLPASASGLSYAVFILPSGWVMYWASSSTPLPSLSPSVTLSFGVLLSQPLLYSAWQHRICLPHCLFANIKQLFSSILSSPFSPTLVSISSLSSIFWLYSPSILTFSSLNLLPSAPPHRDPQNVTSQWRRRQNKVDIFVPSLRVCCVWETACLWLCVCHCLLLSVALHATFCVCVCGWVKCVCIPLHLDSMVCLCAVSILHVSANSHLFMAFTICLFECQAN